MKSTDSSFPVITDPHPDDPGDVLGHVEKIVVRDHGESIGSCLARGRWK